MLSKAAFLLAFVLIWTRTFASQDYPFRVLIEKRGEDRVILAINDGPAPITAKIDVTLEGNAATDRAWPAITTIPTGQSLAIGRVFRAARLPQGYSFRTAISYRIGGLASDHAADVFYRLPFADGLMFPISQAPGGPITTHTASESTHAVDFTMPEGTLVVAARAGIVIKVIGHHKEGRKTPEFIEKANEIVILHGDGTMAHYVHLAPGRQMVRPGQQVDAGAPIGFSGNTGYSSGPHLHFAVSRLRIGENGNIEEISLPITYYANNPPVTFKPMAGTMALADYSAPVNIQARIPARLPEPAYGAAPSDGEDTVLRSLDALHAWVYGLIGPVWWIVVFLIAPLLIFLLRRARRRAMRQPAP